MDFHTDLAVERTEICEHRDSKNVTVKKEKRENAQITEIEILNHEGEDELGKPRGKYITIEVPEFSHDTELLDGRLSALVDAVRMLFPLNVHSALVVGLGNENITPDALGPKTADGIFATRHIDKKSAIYLGLGELTEVSVLAPGVLGQTGIESAELLSSLVRDLKPDILITVDALAARSAARLGNTVQLTDTGLTPGSGVGNHRETISKDTLGIPVVAMGVPTVIDAETLLEAHEQEENADFSFHAMHRMMVCPREIDTVIARASRFLSLGINCALQPTLSPEFLLSIL